MFIFAAVTSMLPIVLFPTLGILVSKTFHGIPMHFLVRTVHLLFISICTIDRSIYVINFDLGNWQNVHDVHERYLFWNTLVFNRKTIIRILNKQCSFFYILKMQCWCLLVDWLLHWLCNIVIYISVSLSRWFPSLVAVSESECIHWNVIKLIDFISNGH